MDEDFELDVYKQPNTGRVYITPASDSLPKSYDLTLYINSITKIFYIDDKTKFSQYILLKNYVPKYNWFSNFIC